MFFLRILAKLNEKREHYLIVYCKKETKKHRLEMEAVSSDQSEYLLVNRTQ